MSHSIRSRKTIIAKIFEKYGFVCFYCKRPLNEFEEYGFDHIIPRSKGGKNISENLVPACKACNSWKWMHSIEEWTVLVEKKIKETYRKYKYCQKILKTLKEV